MVEIHRLHEMLTDAGIEHEWRDRTPPGDTLAAKLGINWGYQIVIYYPNGKRMISAIEGYGTYGFGGWLDDDDSDLIEIMGLLTPEERARDSVVGYLTAEEVFRRIKNELVT